MSGNVDTTTIEIPIEDIHTKVNVDNIRTHFDSRRIEELADSIYENGLLQPILVMQSEDDDGSDIVELIAGERRLRAIQYIRATIDEDFMDTGVPCVSWVGAIEDAEYANAIENIEREEVDEVDTSAWIVRQLDKGVTQDHLAKKVHKSPQWISFRKVFHERACDELKDALREGLIHFSAAYELAKRKDHDEQRKMIENFRKLGKKISLEDAQNVNQPDKSSKPSKKARQKMEAVAQKVAEDQGSETARGVSFGLRYCDGLLTEAEMLEILEMEKQK